MAKFKRGDKVRVSEGAYIGKTGVVIDPCVQISQSDWHYVLLLADDGFNASADEDSLELTEDPYEYNIEVTDLITGTVRMWRGLWEPNTDWVKRKMAESDDYDRKLLNAGRTLEYSRRLVKRMKAGPVEYA